MNQLLNARTKQTNEALSAYFAKHGKKVNVKKNGYFSKQDQFTPSIGFVKKGFFKLVYRKSSKEWIKAFIFENQLLGSLPSILENKTSTYSIQALEASEVIVLPAKELIRCFESELSYLKYLTNFLSQLYIKKEERVSDFLLLKPEDRYKKFLSQYSSSLDRISQNDQAAYLGITHVALSRIKARIFR